MDLLRDVRYAGRLLVKNRWFTVMAVVVLALGIGANNAVFTIVNGVLLRNLPVAQPEEIMFLGTRDTQGQTRVCRCAISRTGRRQPERSPGCRSSSTARSTSGTRG